MRGGKEVCNGSPLRRYAPAPPEGATATTAASGGNREELLGQRPAGCEARTKGRSRRWEPQPGCEAPLACRSGLCWTSKARCGAKGRALLQRAGPSSYNLSVSLRSTAPLVGEPLAKPFTLRGLPKPPLLGATATTAASGGNREELLGPRPAGCERQRSRRWEPQPGQWHRVSDDGEVVRREA